MATHECAGLSSALCGTSNLKLALKKKKKRRVKDRGPVLPAGTAPRARRAPILQRPLPPGAIFPAPPWGVTTEGRCCPPGWSPLADQHPPTSHVPLVSATLAGTGKGTASCDPGCEVQLGTHPPGRDRRLRRRRGFYAWLPRGSWARGQPGPHPQAVALPLPERPPQKHTGQAKAPGRGVHAFHAGSRYWPPSSLQ